MEGFFQTYLRLYRPLISSLNELLSEHNLSYSLWQVIFYLKQNGPATLVEIANRYNVEKPTITRRVNFLEELELVEKMASRDRREKLIQLTASGEDLYIVCREKITNLEMKLTEDLSKNEQQKVFEILWKIQQKLEGNY